MELWEMIFVAAKYEDVLQLAKLSERRDVCGTLESFLFWCMEKIGVTDDDLAEALEKGREE